MIIKYYIKSIIYNNQVVHHNPCFNLCILHNSFDDQGSEKNKKGIFSHFDTQASHLLMS